MAGTIHGYGQALFKHQQEERDLKAKALQEQQAKNQVLDGNDGLNGNVEVLGEVKNGSGEFSGDEISVEQLSLSEGVDGLRKESQTRLGEGRSFGAKVANLMLGFFPMVGLSALKLVMSVVGTTVNLVLGGAAQLLQKAFGLGDDVSAHWRKELGDPMPGSILNDDVRFGGEKMSLPDAMEAVRAELKRKVSQEDMLRYVAMGEKIVHALSGMDADPPPTSVELEHGDGQKVRVYSDLETTRAISWYLQAKALVDNQEYDKGGFLREGSMVAKDPGRKLFNFLKSSDNTYGRVSTHMEERSTSRPTGADKNVFSTFWKGGWDGMFFAGWMGAPLQYGIEDYDDRMPSKGGSLLFDKLTPSEGKDGVPEIFLKWENVGTPFALGGSSNSTGMETDDMWNQKSAFVRFIIHSVGAGGNASPVGYRGEKITKGEAGKFYDEFEELVNALPIDKDVRKNMLEHVETYGALELNRSLDLLISAPDAEVPQESKERFETLRREFGDWLKEQGPSLGIQRKGQEVHVQLTGTVPPREDQPIILHEE